MAIDFNVYVNVAANGEDFIYGLWCQECNMPSGYEVPVSLTSDSGESLGTVLVRQCFDCDSPLAKVDS